MVSICPHLARGRVARLFRCTLWIFWIAAATGVVSSAGAQDTNALFEKWLAVQTNMQSWTGDFTQTRSLKVLAQPLISSGKVWVRPGEFRWELGDPPQTIVLRRPDQLLIMYPQLKRVEKYSLENPPAQLKDALSLLDATLPRDRATMQKQFRLLAAAETNSVLQMTLQPNSASARKFIGQIVIGFSTNDFSIALTQMKFADGSNLRNDFSHVVMNQPIEDARFELKVPPDFTVSEPLHQ